MAPNATLAVGIDLGTTYSAVGVYRKRKVEIFENDAGQRTTPSYVAFCDDEEEEYIGQAAKDLVATKNTLFDSKRLLGRRFDDTEVQQDLNTWSFTVINDGGIPKYEIVKEGLTELIAPEEISAKILKAMKEMAEAKLETEVTKAVVTVPAYFNVSQRQATMAAAKIAKLEVLEILNEPTAAAMAFGFGKGKNGTALIFDFGGGTFDVSLLDIQGDNFNIRAHGGDTHLGGQDFDALLLKYVLKDIHQTLHVNINREEEPDTIHDLRAACELAKRKLSNAPQSTINVFLARHGKGYKKAITRALFEELCTPLFVKAINILAQLLSDVKVSKNEIDDVVLVGGSTRIPKVRSLLQDFFDGKDLNKSVNPDEAVAQGAAIRAAALTGQAGAKEVVIQDVTSLSLGIATSDGLMSVLIRRNTPVPFSITRVFTTAHDNQEEAEYKVCQGERAKWEDNHVLGELTLSIPSKPKGEVEMTATFSLDAGSVLTVTARDTSTNEEITATLHPEARISDKELQDMLRKAQVNQTEDEKIRDIARRNRYKL